MNCQLKTTRLILILINVIFFLIGAILLGEGIDLMVTPRFQSFTNVITVIEKSSITKNHLLSNELLCISMIIPGLFLLSIGFFGCSGAITQIQFLLFCYALIIGIVLIFQTILIISLIMFQSKLKQHIIFRIHSIIRDEYKGPFEDNSQSLSLLCDFVMYNFQCCGIESKNDFDLTNNWNRTNPWWNNSMSIETKYFKYPLACCPINAKLFNRSISCAIHGSDIYEINCYKKLIETFNAFQGLILILLLFIYIIEMFALLFVLVVYNRNRMKRINHVIEGLPPAYSPRTRINNANLYFQI